VLGGVGPGFVGHPAGGVGDAGTLLGQYFTNLAATALFW
jgi:hypothetical protein